jgi:hypothetical protein
VVIKEFSMDVTEEENMMYEVTKIANDFGT